MPTKDEDHSLIEQDAQKVNARKTALIFGLFAVLLAVSTILTLKFTAQPNFCASCHEIAPHVASWSESQHKDVSCLECHTDYGKAGFIIRKFGSFREVYKHFTNKIPSEIEAKINSASCIDCHSGSSKYPKAKNIKLEGGEKAPIMNHAEILQSKTSCLICHEFVGHHI